VTARVRIGVAIALLAVAAALLSLVAGSAGNNSASARGDREFQSYAVQRHQELFGVQNREGPASYADQVAELNAFPAASISQANIATAQAAGRRNHDHGFGHGKNKAGEWVSLGPTSAVYPASLNRHGSEYVTSGRITALAIAPDCDKRRCTVWVGAAGGGVWKTDKALSGNPNWENVSDGFFASGAIGSLTYDAAHNTLYAGTGELAAAGDAEAGVGIYKSTDGGATWTALGGNANFTNRAIRQIAVDPFDPSGNTIYVADGRGVHGISSTTAGPVSIIPGAPPWGVYKSTDGGATFTLLQSQPNGLAAPNPPVSSFGGPRGVTDVAVDPTHAGVVYATSYGQGVFRSVDNGATWTLIAPCTSGCSNTDRSEFALATMPDGHTRMYMTQGDTCTVSSGPPPQPCTDPKLYSKFFVADAVETGTPTFVDKTSADPASPGFATWNFCTGQCWYDEGVYSPAGHPNIVYVFGSFSYNEAPDLSQFSSRTLGGISNARAVLLSQDGGNTFTDLTEDATSDLSPNGIHPDQHALVTVPGNPLQFFEGSDGGLVLSDGTLQDISARCDSRGLSGAVLARCKQLLSAAPGQLTSLNRGLQTLQFQSFSVNPADPRNVQGGTQDNGTFETQGSDKTWPQTMAGDGGLSGFDAADPHFRFHTYFGQQVDVNFDDGDPAGWDWIADPLFAESSLFYFPIVTDPVVSGTMFAGLTHVWRTTDHGGDRAFLDEHCNQFTGDSTSVNPHGTVTVTCGDWVRLGPVARNFRLTWGANVACVDAQGKPIVCPPPYPYGPSRAGGNVGWITRTAVDGHTMWAATTTGRLFISTNADAGDPAAVTFTRLDAVAPDYTTLVPNAPGRAISSIVIDPANVDHAWVTYLGFDANTPTTPGHVFSVLFDPSTQTATWTSLDGSGAGSIGDQPVNAVAADSKTGDLYAATDFGVMRLAADDTASGWVVAAPGLPVVTVPGLLLNADTRLLYAPTHGRGGYQLALPDVGNGRGNGNNGNNGNNGKDKKH
jgi:hypothetical protein